MAGWGEFTDDTLFNGRVRCKQHSRGYRFSLDAVLLGNFVRLHRTEKVLDLGCGCGVVSLILAYRNPSCGITGLEIQPALAELAVANVTANNWQERIEIVRGDLREIDALFPAGHFDWVVGNPPYRKSGSGRVNIEPEQFVARHEETADIQGVIRASVWSLKNGGRAAFVYPASRAATLLYEMKAQGIEPKRMQLVFSYPGSEATLVLVEGAKGGGEELAMLPPFHIYREREGDYSVEMAACYEP